MSGVDKYLLAVYIESQRGGSPVSSGAVADRLDKAAPSVTTMFQRLDERGLVTYEPYEGVALTTAGRDRAEQLHESYVTLSWFFRSVLDLETHESEAMEMAGVIGPAVADRLTTVLPVDETEADGGSDG
jgi:DtxR family Mn-dependent transcriptional regulator